MNIPAMLFLFLAGAALIGFLKTVSDENEKKENK